MEESANSLFTTEVRVSKKARHMRITIKEGGRVVLTLPRGASTAEGERFLSSRKEWILRHRMKRREVPGDAHNKKSDYIEHKESARRLVAQKVTHFNSYYAHAVGAISIRNQKTIWGSCSKRGNLSFNYKVVFLPEEFANYLIVHELCHIKEMNHGARFWGLVAKAIPDYKRIRRALQTRGPRYY